jgi:hypothetical protein
MDCLARPNYCPALVAYALMRAASRLVSMLVPGVDTLESMGLDDHIAIDAPWRIRIQSIKHRHDLLP